jgi:AAA ATPase domain
VASTPRDPLLRLDDPELEWKRYERFCLDLSRALPDVLDAHLYGTRGEDQQGIDIHADLSDGRVRTIQCRRVSKFGKGDAEATIADTTYEADEHVIWAACALTTHARKVVEAADGWDAWDIEQLSSQLRGLPREIARWLVEDHLGAAERRRLLGPETELCLVPASAGYASLDRRAGLLGTYQRLRGRDAELAELRSALEDPAIRVVVLVGRGGIGKTRLLRALADESPERRMLLLLEGVEVTAGLPDELPLASFDVLIDDAHRRGDLRPVLATILRRDELATVVLASRPQRLRELRADLIELGVAADTVRELEPLVELEQARSPRAGGRRAGWGARRARRAAGSAPARRARRLRAWCSLAAQR